MSTNIVRSLDANGDWTFGAGLNNYLSSNAAIGQQIRSNVLSFLGNCFFDTTFGIDWFDLLGGKSPVSINLAVSQQILNTNGVTAINNLYAEIDGNRNLTVAYSVTTIFSTLNGTFSFNLGGL